MEIIPPHSVAVDDDYDSDDEIIDDALSRNCLCEFHNNQDIQSHGTQCIEGCERCSILVFQPKYYCFAFCSCDTTCYEDCLWCAIDEQACELESEEEEG